jgi:hypothetical protein
MKLNLTVLCLLLLNLQCRALADDAKNDLVEERKHPTKAKATVPPEGSNNNVDSNISGNNDHDENDDDAVDDDNSVKSKESSSEIAGESDILPESNAATPKDSVDPEKNVAKPQKIVPKQSFETAIETSKSFEEDNRESSNNANTNDSTNVESEKSKDITTQLYNAISGIATTNITMDAWKNQTWANKSPREVVDMIENEINIMLRDRYVHFVFITMGLVSLLLTLYIVQQIIEHPRGVISKFCRCTIACIRILCCPLYTILCCPCCTTKKNRNTKEYSHLPLHDVNDASKKN